MTGEENGGAVFDADLALKAVRPGVDQLDLISRSGRPTRVESDVASSPEVEDAEAASDVPSEPGQATHVDAVSAIGIDDTLVPEPILDARDASDDDDDDEAPHSDDPTESADDPRIPPDQAFFKIGEVADIVGVKPYVLRYWENEFSWVKPEKTSSRQRRYRRQDVAVLLQIKRLRYEEQLTVARARELIRDSRRRGATGLPTSLATTGTAAPGLQVPAAKLAQMRQIIAGLLEAAEED